MVLAEPTQEHRGWVGPVSSVRIDIQEYLGVEVDCKIFPKPRAVNYDSGFVYSDPLRSCQRRNGVPTGSQDLAPVNSGGSGTLPAAGCGH